MDAPGGETRVAFGEAVSCARAAPEPHGEHSGKALVSCWDGGVSLVDCDAGATLRSYHHAAAALTCCFGRVGGAEVRGVSGGLDRAVHYQDLGAGITTAPLGTHNDAVRCVAFLAERGIVVSGGWDAAVKTWDPRVGDGATATTTEPNKVFAMDACDNTGQILVAHAGRTLRLYDVRDMSKPLEERDSSLQYQTRAVRFTPDGAGYALGCIAGRVVVDYFEAPRGAGEEPAAARRTPFKFKCHRSATAIYPVNALAFHPVHGTFATGGCDATVCVWDHINHRRTAIFKGFGNSVSSIDFSADGTRLLVAVSYTFEEGPQPEREARNFLAVRPLKESEVRPKAKARAAEPQQGAAPEGEGGS